MSVTLRTCHLHTGGVAICDLGHMRVIQVQEAVSLEHSVSDWAWTCAQLHPYYACVKLATSHCFSAFSLGAFSGLLSGFMNIDYVAES
ncbi:hypothetical protein GDO78_007641 [Eleutherodactylus coqui]|uniref:Uncharacterized protein n=1 Tax=Eleutherodactylus coqui TaxID=57060 RepID=A0A8J6FH26_ELECQ|nr:hypothetical protein GDO78_007641 [Eleutherodactylus coqui]